MKSKLLQIIDAPDDLRELSLKNLEELTKELRDFIIQVVATKEGHLGASLGVIELSIALHYVFDTPNDQLIWDVGHQAYAHKILTGRKDRFHTNRQLGGLSGFPSRDLILNENCLGTKLLSIGFNTLMAREIISNQLIYLYTKKLPTL